MKILPSDKIEIISSLSIQEVRDNIYQNICSKRDFFSRIRNKKNDKTFEGRILDDKFSLQLIINMNNSFLPQITGEIQSVPNGTKITADLKLHKQVVVFMVFWFIFTLIGLLVISFEAIMGNINPFLIFVPILFFIFGYGLVNFGYNMEKDNSINGLKRIISGEKIQYVNYNKKL